MLTYGIFLFLSVFPIIHPKGLTPIPEENMENTELLPLGTEQGREETEYSSFDLCLGESFVSPLVEQHRQWLKSIRHETPSPKIPFKVAVYIRFFNQTKYGDEEYLERNKEVFRATLAQYLMTGTDAPGSGNSGLSPLSVSGKRIRAVPKKLADRFGSDFYSHRLTASSLELQSEDAWKLWLEGQLFETSEKLHVTKFDEMQRFINEQLSASKQLEGADCNA